MKLKLKIYYKNWPLPLNCAYWNCFFIFRNKTLLSKLTRKICFLAFVLLGRNSTILPKPVLSSTGHVLSKNMGMLSTIFETIPDFNHREPGAYKTQPTLRLTFPLAENISNNFTGEKRKGIFPLVSCFISPYLIK